MQPNLSKENFWDDLTRDMPDKMAYLGAWIDEYKTRNKWQDLFPSGFNSLVRGDNQTQFSSAKFHDLPLAMQMGILLEFMHDHKPGSHITVMDYDFTHEGLCFTVRDFFQKHNFKDGRAEAVLL